MDAGERHPVDRPDGSRHFAFEGTQVVDILDKTCCAESVRLVEDLVADAATLGQAAFGQLHAQASHLVLRHHDGGTVVLQLMGIAWRSRSLMIAEGSSTAQVREQGGHLRRGDPHDDEGKEADERGR